MADFSIEEYISSRSSFDPAEEPIVTLIEHAKIEIGNFEFDERIYNKAVSLLVLHWATLGARVQGDEQSSNVVGGISGEKEGDLSRTYKVHGEKNISDAFLSQTSFGLELLSLRKRFIFTPRNRLCCDG